MAVALVMANHSFTQRHVDIIHMKYAHITELIMRAINETTAQQKPNYSLAHITDCDILDIIRKYIIEYFKCAHIKTTQHSTAQHSAKPFDVCSPWPNRECVRSYCVRLLHSHFYHYVLFFFPSEHSHFMKVSFSFFFFIVMLNSSLALHCFCSLHLISALHLRWSRAPNSVFHITCAP